MEDLRNHINTFANQHKEPVDKEVLWAGIENKISKPKKKRRFIPLLFWGISLSIGAITILGYYYNTNNISNTNEAGLQFQNEDPITLEHSINSTNNLSEIKNPSSKIADNIVDNSFAQLNEKLSGNTTIENNQDITSIKSLLTNNQNTKAKETYSIEQQIQAHNNSENDLGLFINQEQIELKKENTASNKYVDKVMLRRDVFTINKITTPFNLEYVGPRIDIPSDFVFPIPVSSKENKKFSFLNSLTVYSQIGLGNKTIQGDSEYARLRNESEELLEQIRFGIESDLISLLDFTFYGGVSYVSINDRVKLSKSYFEDQEIMFLKSIFISQDGNEEKIFDTKPLPHHVINNKVIHNSNRFISMPIGLKFGKDFSKLYLGLGFGLDLNYHLPDIHTIFANDDEFLEIAVGGKWTKPSLHTAIIAEYPISESWIIHSKLMHRSTSLDHNLKENYTLYGIDLGIKFRF